MKTNHTIMLKFDKIKGRPKVETLVQHLVRLGIKPHTWIMAWFNPSKN